MTKKVLISLHQLQNIRINSFGQAYIRSDYKEQSIEDWFDAQPDISDIIADSVKEGLENARESFIEAALSKMQITGYKNDN